MDISPGRRRILRMLLRCDLRENFLTCVLNSLFHSSMVHCGSAIFSWREIPASDFRFFFFNIIIAGASRTRKTLVILVLTCT